jgi:hypothetical protein
MFDLGAVADDGWQGTVRPQHEPLPVLVDLSRLWPPDSIGSGNVPLRVRAFGLDNGDVATGELYEWVQLRTGGWLAGVRFTATSINGRLRREIDQFVPAAAIRPARRSGPGSDPVR